MSNISDHQGSLKSQSLRYNMRRQIDETKINRLSVLSYFGT